MYTIKAEKDPEGYSEPSWGYVVVNTTTGDIWADGGYASKSAALIAGGEVRNKLIAADDSRHSSELTHR